MVTIYDIARETGFSAPTVSKALTGTGTLSVKTRQLIQDVAQKMGYEPNYIARSLSTNKSNIIGVIFDDVGMKRGFSHPLFSAVLDRFRERMEKEGYDLLFLSSHFKMSYFSHVMLRHVDGVIVINPVINSESNFGEFLEAKIPCVSTSSFIPGIPTVVTENFECGYIAGKALILKGHKKIAYLSGSIDNYSPAAKERFEGLKKAFEDYGLTFDESLFEDCHSWESEAGYEGFKRLMKRNPDFSAVFASSDTLAFGVYNFAKEYSIRIPSDLAIIGFDDDRISSVMSPKLSTFRHDSLKIADLAAESLLAQINGKSVELITRVPASFIPRESI